MPVGGVERRRRERLLISRKTLHKGDQSTGKKTAWKVERHDHRKRMGVKGVGASVKKVSSRKTKKLLRAEKRGRLDGQESDKGSEKTRKQQCVVQKHGSIKIVENTSVVGTHHVSGGKTDGKT